MVKTTYPGVPAETESGTSDTEAGARTGDPHDGGDRHLCGAETTDGSQCSREIAAARERCWQHEESPDGDETSESEGMRAQPDTVERRLGLEGVATHELREATVGEAVEEWQKSHDGDLFDGTSYKPGREPTTVASAAKALIREKHGSWPHETVKSLFGTCAREGCSRWANGYTATHCGRADHGEKSPDGDDTSDDEATRDDANDANEAPAHDSDAGITVKLPDGTVMEGLSWEQAREAKRLYDS